MLDMGRGCCFTPAEEGMEATSCKGCFKLHASDWLADYPDNFPDDIYEIRFKNTRKGYYRNVNGLALNLGDIVAVEASPGHDIGIVSLSGDMVARQMKRVGFNPQNGEFKKIYRKAKPFDIEKWMEAIALEHPTMIRARQIAADMKLNMKIGDVEYQGDKVKAIFYYIADERVDFRELIKVFAEQFRIRIEMKQIGARQEAGRIGGLGACGRELCCASWISNFVSVTTNAARIQEISLNPQKLAGQCSKLKCCLVYELDDYMDARRDFPRIKEPLQALDGEYFLVKSDILGRTMSFSTSPNAMVGVVTLPVERVKEILEMNRKGKKPEQLQAAGTISAEAEEPDFVNAIGEESITRFDTARKRKGKGRGRAGVRAEEERGAVRGDRKKSKAEQETRTGEETGRTERNGRNSRAASEQNRDNRSDRSGKKRTEPNRENRTEPNHENQAEQGRENRDTENRREGRDNTRRADNRPRGAANRVRPAANGQAEKTERPVDSSTRGERSRRNGSAERPEKTEGSGSHRRPRPKQPRREGTLPPKSNSKEE